MQELLTLIRELADTLARISQPIDSVGNTDAIPFEPWLEFEPVNGLTYL